MNMYIKTNSRLKKLLLLLSVAFFFAGTYLLSPQSTPIAQTEDLTFIVYFTGIGCPHCANADPAVLKDLLTKHPDLMVVEYEIYQKSQNAALLSNYNEKYGSGMGIPVVVFNQDTSVIGDNPILGNIETALQNNKGNPLPLHDGNQATLTDLSLNSLPHYPNIWHNDRIAIRTGTTSSNLDSLLIQFLTSEDLEKVFEDTPFQLTTPEAVQLSGSEIDFENAAIVDGWRLQWNGDSIEGEFVDPSDIRTDDTNSSDELDSSGITIAKTLSLGAVDAINPCALAVLTMMLLAIITYNPKNKKNIILAGLAFSASVFVMYMLYGLVIIRFFQLVQAITSVRLVLYKVLAVVAIILGALQIKDFVSYKAGGLGTEMPLFMRSKVKKIISGITSPKGAFGVGVFVTIFLLPCTVGPYIILGGMLSFSKMLQSIPYLLLYNLIFILPMLIITGFVYVGISKVEDVSKWKDKNIKTLHLVSGIIIAGLGIAMLLGWV